MFDSLGTALEATFSFLFFGFCKKSALSLLFGLMNK